MSDSDSDASPVKPSDSQIEQCLKKVVARLLRLGDGQQLTVKNARTAAEEELQLPAGFFKADARWKDRSKDLITEAATELQEATIAEAQEPAPKPAKTNGAANPKRGTKRVSPDADEEPQPQDGRKKKKPKVAARGRKDASGDEEDETSAQDDTRNHKTEEPDKAGTMGDDDDLSSLSDVRDSPPPAQKKKRRKKTDSNDHPPPKSKPKPATKTSSAPDLAPQEAEIKRLQSQLVKCGIRKLWHRELAAHPTDRAKIAHLRAMLAGAGMEGRFSEDKARQIRERRELAADLEAVTEGNKMWGQSGDEDEQGEGEGKAGGKGEAEPRRRLAKGLRDISAFISDGEETD